MSVIEMFIFWLIREVMPLFIALLIVVVVMVVAVLWCLVDAVVRKFRRGKGR